MRRWPPWLRLLLAGIAGWIAGYVALLAVVAGLAGIGWIFIFGDDPWPEWSGPAILVPALAAAAFAGWTVARAVWRATVPK